MNNNIEREIQTDAEAGKPASASEERCRRECLFWSFPGGKGAIQPWRRKLWELQNNSDRE
ncbi:hypothetical protein [Paenibacillus sp. HW567]|uniref:hypothetical protein n=1 Tax=Paenibacillus sp. HW567 TaxID=1034769 RepID=UPI0012EC0E3E|nr:hypothetical protein [Paenibacillus sp. HW567]